MVLSLDLKPARDQVYGRWVRKGRPAFMGSEAYDILAEAMRRYVRAEIPGQSFLIAGHRGTGKTALVAEVVEAITDDIFERYQRWADERPNKPSLAPPREAQRPLLVKLHGPSLLGTELPSPGGGENPTAKPPPSEPVPPAVRSSRRWAAGSVVEVVNVNSSPPAQAAKPDGDGRTAPTGPAQAALVQITIGLYRALAREVGEAGAMRALERQGADPDGHGLELAAQLRLELDRMAGPDVLRDFWEAIEPGGCGILWPQTISRSFAEYLAPDQQFREIVAVATAAQAYQVCSGAVSYNKTRKDTAAQERSVEVRASFDARDAVNRAITLGIGGLLGYGIAGAAGAGIGLLGGLGASSLSRRSSKREQTEDYTFIVDRSVETLERDLPLVIERVRAAGLAPVFVVDELDKLPDTAGGSVSDSIRSLINRLKHLTTDSGFFCFLTGRDYFDQVEQVLAGQAYPVEHTFFSERLLIGYGPDDFDAYVNSVVSGVSAGREDRAAKYVLSKTLTLDSRLNTIDFLRELWRGWYGGDGPRTYKTGSDTLTGATPNLIAVAVQLAIEQVLTDPSVTALIAREPGFRQMAFDVLYRVSREWERDQPTIDLSNVAIARDLLARRREICPDKVDPEKRASELIGAANLAALNGMVRMLANLVVSFEHFSIFVEAGPAATSPDREFIAQVFTSLKARRIGRLLKRGDVADEYVFMFKRDGTDLFSDRTIEEVRAQSNLSRVCLQTLADLGVSLVDLAFLRWPLTLSSQSVEDAIKRALQTVYDENPQAARTASASLDQFIQVLTAKQDAISGALSLAADIARESGYALRPWLPEMLTAMDRYLYDPALILAQRPLTSQIATMSDMEISAPLQFPITDTGAVVRKWSAAIETRRKGAMTVALDARAARAWNVWLNAIHNYVESGMQKPSFQPPEFNDLVLFAAGRLPSSVLTYDLTKVDKRLWTVLLLTGIASQWTRAGSDTTAEYVPLWAPLAALRILGFGRDIFELLLIELPFDTAMSEPTRGQIDAFLPMTGERGPGVMAVANGPLASPPIGPYILVSPNALLRFVDELAWLSDLGVIGSKTYELK